MGLLDKISSMRQRSKDKKEFFEDLVRAAADGRLTEDEMKELHAQYKQLELTQDDLKKVRVQAYEAALHAAQADGKISAEEEAELQKLQHFFKIPDSDISGSKRTLARLRLLTEIQNGNPPTISVSNVVLQKGESAYWSERASLYEERVVSRRYEGGSRGMSFRIMKGVSYRVGSHRGHLITDKAMVPVSTGELIITNRRAIFRGDAKSFAIKLDKLLEVSFYADGVRLTDDKGKPRMMQFETASNTDVIGAVLSHAVNAID